MLFVNFILVNLLVEENYLGQLFINAVQSVSRYIDVSLNFITLIYNT